MTEFRAASPVSTPVAEIERHIKWRVLALGAFACIIVGLATLAVVSQFSRPRLVTGLPDGAEVRAADVLVHDQVLPETGRLRFVSALLGSGALSGAVAAPKRLQVRRAQALIERVHRANAWDPRIESALGALELVQGHYVRAERLYRAALDRNAHFGEARLGLGVTLALRASIAPQPLKPRALRLAAIAQFAAVPEQDPAYEHALFNRAMLLDQVGREEEARRIARDYLLRDPESAWAAELEPVAAAR